MMIVPVIQANYLIQTAYSARGSELDPLAITTRMRASAGGPRFFRTCPSDTIMMDATASLIQKLGWNQVVGSRSFQRL